jgi:hypothetical protein
VKIFQLTINALTAGIISAAGVFTEGVASDHQSEWFPYIIAATFAMSAAKDLRSQMQEPPPRL